MHRVFRFSGFPKHILARFLGLLPTDLCRAMKFPSASFLKDFSRVPVCQPTPAHEFDFQQAQVLTAILGSMSFPARYFARAWVCYVSGFQV